MLSDTTLALVVCGKSCDALSPVPGIDAVTRARRPKFRVSGAPPIEVEMPDLDTLTRTPATTRKLLRNRNAIWNASPPLKVTAGNRESSRGMMEAQPRRAGTLYEPSLGHPRHRPSLARWACSSAEADQAIRRGRPSHHLIVRLGLGKLVGCFFDLLLHMLSHRAYLGVGLS